jgi:endonuclease III
MKVANIINDDAEKVIEFIEFLNFDFNQESRYINNDHMGAIIAEVVLQAGLNYRNVVKPRVDHIIKNYPLHSTINSMLMLIELKDVTEILNWQGKEKIDRFINLLVFCEKHKIDNTIDFKNWIVFEENEQELLALKGIGPKTVDYLKLLLGIQSIPIDRHLFNFARLSGVKSKKYSDVSLLYKNVSKMLNVDCTILDSVIWNFMRVVSV